MLITNADIMAKSAKYDVHEFTPNNESTFVIFRNRVLFTVTDGRTVFQLKLHRARRSYFLQSDRIIIQFMRKLTCRLGNTLYYAGYSYPIKIES